LSVRDTWTIDSESFRELKSSMTARVQRNFGRSATVAIAICSWLAISNHCAFSAVAAPVGETQSACPFHSKPAKQKKHSAGVQCCKTLRAVVPTVTKSWTRNDTDFSDVDLYFEKLALIATSRNALLPLLLDTGPPGARSFAELILQRSILAHAPPSLA
jgi:hypothetical protein